MPPRYAYWTILVDEQPTAFRAADANDLQPTFKRLQQKHPSARMVWFQNGKIWKSRLEAQEAMRVRGERGRQGDFRQRESERVGGKLEWKPKGTGPAEGWSRRSAARPPEPEGRRWEREGGRPKGSAPAEGREPRRSTQRGGKLEWRPKGSPPDSAHSGPQDRRPSGPQDRRPSGARRARANESGERRDKTWRPGGDHKDPRQKYKDARKAKWTRFKKQIRSRWESKQGKKKSEE